MLHPDGSFEMKHIPVEANVGPWSSDDKVVHAQGTWTVGDDGEGSWEVFVQLTQINGRGRNLDIRLRPGDGSLRFDSAGLCLYSFDLVKPKGHSP